MSADVLNQEKVQKHEIELRQPIQTLFQYWWKRHFGDWVWLKEGIEVSVIFKEDASINKLITAGDQLIKVEVNAQTSLFFTESQWATHNEKLADMYKAATQKWLKHIAISRLRLENAIKAI